MSTDKKRSATDTPAPAPPPPPPPKKKKQQFIQNKRQKIMESSISALSEQYMLQN